MEAIAELCAAVLVSAGSGHSVGGVHGAGDGIVALMIRPGFDYVLNPSVSGSTLPLVTFPNGYTVYLNRFFPPVSTTSGLFSR